MLGIPKVSGCVVCRDRGRRGFCDAGEETSFSQLLTCVCGMTLGRLAVRDWKRDSVGFDRLHRLLSTLEQFERYSYPLSSTHSLATFNLFAHID